MGFKGKSISVASYDAGNRLTAWNRAGADENHSQTWDYDDAGNWNSTTKDGDTEGRNHSVSNQITQLDGKAVSHDLKGNLTDYEYDRTDYRVKYDLDNRIVEVKADSETIRYRYDALGRRIISKGDDETILIWWGDSECAEYEHRASQDAIQNDIMGHPARLNSVIARDTEDRENRVELQWYHKNYLDHVYAVSDDNGNLIEHYRYTAFGEPEIYSATGAKRNTSAIGNTVMWNTRRYDADSGLYYYWKRHYSANLRWLSRDPIEEEGGVNLYAFVGNEPIGRWDEYGESDHFSAAPYLDYDQKRLRGVAKGTFFHTIEWEAKRGTGQKRKADLDGIILQKVVVSFEIYECEVKDGETDLVPITSIEVTTPNGAETITSGYTYWEAWVVEDGDVGKGKKGGYDTFAFNEDKSDLPHKHCGRYSMKGNAIFYPGATIPGGMPIGGAKMAGGLHSTKTDPSNQIKPDNYSFYRGLDRNTTVSWNAVGELCNDKGFSNTELTHIEKAEVGLGGQFGPGFAPPQ